jgi:DNA-binding response OmpR family regulator
MSATLADQAIDLVVLDLRLAGEDGMTLARKLREESAIPVIMLTGVRTKPIASWVLNSALTITSQAVQSPELLARIRPCYGEPKGRR